MTRSRGRLIVVLGAVAPLLGACANDLMLNEMNPIPKLQRTLRPDWMLYYSGVRQDLSAGPVSQDQLMSADGQCAQVANTAASGDPSAPAFQPGGVALQMAECEVVQRIGAPERFEFVNYEGDRGLVLTYARGPRPGIYRFAAGRLYSIEAAPEPPAAARPTRPAKAAKKKPGAT